MTYLASFFAIVLFLTAGVHIAWGLGVLWPAKTEKQLIKTVIGFPGATQMPNKWITFIVALGIAVAGVFLIWGANLISLPLPQFIKILGLATLTAIFLIRGVLGLMPFGPFINSTEPFNALNKRYYSPLIVAIGVCCAILLAQQI